MDADADLTQLIELIKGVLNVPAQFALSLDTSLTRERIRQIVRRASKHMAELVHADSRFAMLAELAGTTSVVRKPATRSTTIEAAPTMLPAMHQPHNAMVTVSKAQGRAKPGHAAPSAFGERLSAVHPTAH